MLSSLSSITWIKGVIRRQYEMSIDIQCQNIAYMVLVSPGRFSLLNIGSEIELEIVAEWHDDGAHLYGFPDIESKDTFSLLRSIKGVGGKSALNILSLFDVDEFHQIILNKNYSKLERTPKIGPRLAQRIVSELQGRIDTEINLEIPLLDQARESMLSLGYSVSDINKTIQVLCKDEHHPTWNIQTWLKNCMKVLSAEIINKSHKVHT